MGVHNAVKVFPKVHSLVFVKSLPYCCAHVIYYFFINFLQFVFQDTKVKVNSRGDLGP